MRSPESKKPSGSYDGLINNKETREPTPKVDDRKRWDSKIELALKTVQHQLVPENNIRDEDIREEYVETDLELSLGVPRHLMDHEESKSSYPREETGGGMRHIGRYIESNGISEKKARERDTDII